MKPKGSRRTPQSGPGRAIPYHGLKAPEIVEGEQPRRPARGVHLRIEALLEQQRTIDRASVILGLPDAKMETGFVKPFALAVEKIFSSRNPNGTLKGDGEARFNETFAVSLKALLPETPEGHGARLEFFSDSSKMRKLRNEVARLTLYERARLRAELPGDTDRPRPL